MIYQEWYLKSRWFAESAPVNPKHATASLVFTDVVVAAETVTIDGTVFEFVAAAGDIAEPTNIPVVVGTTLTSVNAVAKLVTAITATLDNVVASVGVDSNEHDYCGLAYHIVGTEGNAITVATTCTNASFGVDVTALSGGQFGTPCPEVNTIVKDTTYHYICTTAGNKDDVAWKRFTPAIY